MKKLVSLVLSLCLVLSMGVFTSASAEPTEIVFWTALSGNYDEAIQKICDDFNASQDQWKVVAEYQGNYYDIAAKLQAALLDGSEPDIVQMDYMYISTYAQNGSLADLSEYINDGTIDASGIDEALMNASNIGGKTVGIPLSTSLVAFTYNPSVLEEAGVDVPTDDWTWDDFATAAKTVKEKTGKEPLDAFTEGMNNIMPSLEVKARRVGGATYQVPMEVRPERRQTLGLRWLTGYARKRSEKTMKERLAGEIMDACNNTGAAVKKREDTHKMAESNKAFAHFRW